ncbi:MAG: hypothetical protein M1827_005625 [Pycnora praestabilis]|nr:MAG: hypothetical protein M1827_005625 [Pycnora praestabilis]
MAQMSLLPRSVRSLILSFLLSTVILFFYVSGNLRLPSSATSILGLNPESHDRKVFLKGLKPYLKASARLLIQSRPDCDPIDHVDPAPEPIAYRNADESLNRAEYLEIPGGDIQQMQAIHSRLVHKIPTLPELPYISGTRGIVTTAGGRYLPPLVVTILELRRTGSELPVEVFLADPSEYESEICEVELPKLNARCVVLSNHLEPVGLSYDIGHYQLKIFAILLSSFEDILFLDADNFAIRKPDEVFDSEPYVSEKMVVWPDFWVSTASPTFYEIASISAPPLLQQAATESGQLMISKRTHAATLFLAAYYNYYGPNYFYPLLAQSAPGEGDKDTFVAAALANNQSFYAIEETVKAIGYFSGGVFKGCGMIQADPREDFIFYNINSTALPSKHVTNVPGLFAHLHSPKYNAARLPEENDDQGQRVRLMGSAKANIERYGRDLELDIWESMYTTCGMKFKDWDGVTSICEQIGNTVASLKITATI